VGVTRESQSLILRSPGHLNQNSQPSRHPANKAIWARGLSGVRLSLPQLRVSRITPHLLPFVLPPPFLLLPHRCFPSFFLYRVSFVLRSLSCYSVSFSLPVISKPAEIISVSALRMLFPLSAPRQSTFICASIPFTKARWFCLSVSQRVQAGLCY
jgi:hypothetical protein